MKPLKTLGIIAAIIVLGLIGHIGYLFYLADAETYPSDTFLDTEANKTALIIVAHDDDAVSMAGTISKLTQQGWKVSELCFYQGWKGRDSTRKVDLQKVAEIEQLESVEYHDILLRVDRATVESPWKAIPYADFDSVYNKAPLRKYIKDFIDIHQPSVIFTLDDIVGGYGHPEHALMSQLVLEYCREHLNNPEFSVKNIYQAVFPPSVNEKVLKDQLAFNEAKRVWGFERTPSPSVQINISDMAEQKQKVMLSYSTEQNSLTKIWPFYNYYPAKLYFNIFNKEYYRVLERENGYNALAK
jgi:LmbE family N-acetylglucosaminyl deacetylase